MFSFTFTVTASGGASAQFQTAIQVDGCSSVVITIPSAAGYQQQQAITSPSRTDATYAIPAFDFDSGCSLNYYTLTGRDRGLLRIEGTNLIYPTQYDRELSFNLVIILKGWSSQSYASTIKIQGCDGSSTINARPGYTSSLPQAVVDKPTRKDTVFTFQADDFVWSDPACKLEPEYSIKDIKVNDVPYVQ